MAIPKGKQLIKLNVVEVSLVDRAANREGVLLEKSAAAELAACMAKVEPVKTVPAAASVSYDSAMVKSLLS